LRLLLEYSDTDVKLCIPMRTPRKEESLEPRPGNASLGRYPHMHIYIYIYIYIWINLKQLGRDEILCKVSAAQRPAHAAELLLKCNTHPPKVVAPEPRSKAQGPGPWALGPMYGRCVMVPRGNMKVHRAYIMVHRSRIIARRGCIMVHRC
jgi:hypothetical protein